jgi:hypothetical protein
MNGTNNLFETPSYKSIEDIVSINESAITWVKRNADKLNQKEDPKPEVTEDQESKEEEIKPKTKRTIERTDLTVTDLILSSNHKVKILVVGIFFAGFGIGVTLGASKLYKEKIAPLIDLYKAQDTPAK